MISHRRTCWLRWQDAFAWADSWDDAAGRYRGLRGGEHVSLDASSPGLLVKPSVASAQLAAERRAAEVARDQAERERETPADGTREQAPVRTGATAALEPPKGFEPLHAAPKRYHGTVTLDATRVGRDAGRIADEVISHLVGLVGARVTVTLEIEADLPEGAPAQVVRTVTENARTLRFRNPGFERE